MKTLRKIRILQSVALLVLPLLLQAVERFPKPEFETAYQYPQVQDPAPRGDLLQYLDVAVLAGALGLAAWLVLRRRSRRGVFVLMVFSVIYFGFWRKGCVCPIGAIQNVAQAVFDPTCIVPFTVLLFFLLPLLFALFFGRVFCAGVCPLGALQDFFVLKPVKVPVWLCQILEMLPYAYLGFGVLFAATGTGFVICWYDPFVAFFRFGGSLGLLIFGCVLLAVGTVVGRPYCRFLCPYSVLLNWMSRLSRVHLSVTPDACIQCRLCEDACPFDAICEPTPERLPEERNQARTRLVRLLLLLPVMAVIGGVIGRQLAPALSRVHNKVALAERLSLEAQNPELESTLNSRTFRGTGQPISKLYEEVQLLRQRFRTGGWLLGTFLGLVLGCRLVGLSVWRTRRDYAPDRGRCLSCARCIVYCPKEHVRLESTNAVD